MAVHRRYDILAILLMVLLVLAYASVRSEFRLRTEMPREFFDAANFPPERRNHEEKIARAYWKCAVTQIQWKYGYAHRLPEEPPAEFVADGQAPARARYWQELREVWMVSAVWHRQYEWNTISLNESLQSAGQWMERHMRRMVNN